MKNLALLPLLLALVQPAEASLRSRCATLLLQARPRLAREARSPDYIEGQGLSVAMIGDSVSRDFEFASTPRNIWQLWARWQRDAFLNTDPSNGIHSVFERLAAFAPVKAKEYSRPGARVTLPGRPALADRLLRLVNIKSVAGQVDEILAEKSFPDLTLLWIGNNNMDFLAEPNLEVLRQEFIAGYRASLERLIGAARLKNGRSAIVVYGLINAEATTAAREKARLEKRHDPSKYPYFDVGDRRFRSMRPENQQKLVAVARLMSADLRQLVAQLQSELGPNSNVQLSYSDETQQADFSNLDFLSPVDAWHASLKGRNQLATALFEGASPALEFLMSGPNSTHKESDHE